MISGIRGLKTYLLGPKHVFWALSFCLCFSACATFQSENEKVATINLDSHSVPLFKYGRPPGWDGWTPRFGGRTSSVDARRYAFARRRALQGGNFRYENYGIRLGVFDVNQNGSYTDTGVDYVTVAPYASDTLPIFPSITSRRLPILPFSIKMEDQIFEVLSIEKEGLTAEIAYVGPAQSFPGTPYIRYETRIPDLPFVTLSGDTSQLADYLVPGKYLYVECWSTWFQQAIDGLPELKAAYLAHQDHLEVVQLVMNEVDYQRVEDHVNTYQLPWTQGIYTDTLGKYLMQSSIPYGILYDPEGNLIKSRLLPGELAQFLNQVW